MWYTFNQNNSGGSFHIDKKTGITVVVIVEADSAEEANDRAENIGLYFDGIGDCPCCGDRWCSQCDDDEGTKEPKIYGMSVTDYVRQEERYLWAEKGFNVVLHPKKGPFRWL